MRSSVSIMAYMAEHTTGVRLARGHSALCTSPAPNVDVAAPLLASAGHQLLNMLAGLRGVRAPSAPHVTATTSMKMLTATSTYPAIASAPSNAVRSAHSTVALSLRLIAMDVPIRINSAGRKRNATTSEGRGRS